MLSTAGNPKESVPYGNPSGRPPEESIPIVLAPQFERPASPTPLEGQSFAKKGKSDGSLGANGSEDMDADGVMVINDGLKDADRAYSGDALKAGESQLQFENPSLGKATYASVVDKDSSNSNMAKSGSKFVEEEIEDTKEVESFGPWMVAETRRRRPAGRTTATDNTRSLVGSSRFAALEVPEEGTVVTGMAKEYSVTREADLGNTEKQLDVGAVGNGITKNAAYMASNPDKRVKAGAVQTRNAMVVPTVAGQSATVVEHITGGLKGSHTAVKIMEPAVKGRSGQVGVRSSGFKGRMARTSVAHGVRGRRAGEPSALGKPSLTAVGQSSAGLQGNMIAGLHPPVLIPPSSDEETLYEMSDEEAMIEAEEGERLLA
ncbi:hypothetical protein V6N13_011378 [Hibiscus sabdariffa]|uniref:Uncharacterized protein n=1 Tax=Hibiscus sabdariffa TaxID=183260 RepID=A0ABR2SCN9_9ROSI